MAQKKIVLPTDAHEPNFTIEVVTPELAEEWLEHNENNRSMSSVLVRQYARDMEQGNWKFVGDPIRFAPDGNLIDGQKRLAAVVLSGTTQKFIVGREIPEDDRLILDSGQKRSAAHSMQMQGLRDANNVAAMVRLLLQWQQELLLERVTFSNQELSGFVETFEPDLYKAISIGHQARSAMYARVPVAGAVYFRSVHHFGQDFTDNFYEKLISGEEIPSGSPIGAFRRSVWRAKTDNYFMPRNTELYYNIRALNAVAKDEKLVKMNLPRGDWRNEHFTFITL